VIRCANMLYPPLLMSFSIVSFRMSLSDLAKYWMTQKIARSVTADFLYIIDQYVPLTEVEVVRLLPCLYQRVFGANCLRLPPFLLLNSGHPSLPFPPSPSSPSFFPSPLFPYFSLPSRPLLPLRSRPLKSSMGSAVNFQPQPKSNLVHFSRKIWHLVETILMILLRTNWPNFVQLKQ